MENQNTDAGYSTESQHSISINNNHENDIATSIRKMIGDFPTLSPNCCIFKAPKRLRELDKEREYIPLLVSIGPFHHGRKFDQTLEREELQSMEKLKPAYLNAFLNRCSNEISLETCIEMIKDQETRIRECYAETIEFNEKDFVKMILFDSCFVIEIIYRYNYVDYSNEVTDQLSHSRIAGAVLDDMILLENQLPFFVLQKLFDLAFPNAEGEDCFSNLCIEYFSGHLLSGTSKLAKENISQIQSSEIKHLLDLLRMCQKPSIQRQTPTKFSGENSMRNATQLVATGMVIKERKKYKSAADIIYTRGVLEIPKLMVNTSSERVLRNLIGLELCLYSHESFISDYIHFIDSLVDTKKDVELLIENDVIQNFASDNTEVANLFNNLRPRLLLRNYFYHEIQEEVIAYSKVPHHKWRATLKRDYCSSPWMIVSIFAASILLFLTLIQTGCALYEVIKD